MMSASSPGIDADFASALARRPGNAGYRFRLPVSFVMGAVWLGDIVALTASGLITCALAQPSPAHATDVHAPETVALLLATVAAWAGITVLQQCRTYRISALRQGARKRAVGAAVFAGGMFFAAGAALQHQPPARVAELSVLWLAVASPVLFCMRVTTGALALRLCTVGLIARRLAVVGTAEGSRAFTARLQAAGNPSLRLTGVYEIGDAADCLWAPRLAQLESDSRRGALDAVVLAMPDADDARVGVVRQALSGIAVDIYLAAAPRLAECSQIVRLGGVPAGLIASRPLSGWQAAQKEIFDRIASAILIIIAAPAMALIALLIKLDSKGPILFRQSRTGYNNVPFTCLKFRSMRHGEPADPFVQQAVRGDSRITRVGAILRRTSLDELPQLFNVFRGDMSLVGPRPHAPTTRAAGRLFTDIVPHYGLRHTVKPGITGWAQIHGHRGETPTVDAVEARIRYDLEYVRNWSMLLDLRILIRTALIFLHDPNAY